jgi:hypothetical protein
MQLFQALTKNILLIGLSVWLSACGGGSSSSVDSGITYAGLTTPAVIDTTNAKFLAERVIGNSTTGGAFGVVGNKQDVQPNPTILDVARILSDSVTRLDISPSFSTRSGAVVSDSGSIPCAMGGSILFSLNVDDVTGDFSGTVNFINCAEGGTTMNGNATVSGTINLFSFLIEVIKLTFNSMTIISGTESYTMSGTVDTSNYGGTITMDVRLRNNNTQMVEWMNNLTINISSLGMTITGRYYHPEYGYVDTVTDQPFQFNFSDQWPYAGQATITGANGSKTHLTVVSNTQYTLEVDADGDDTYETVTTENFGDLTGNGASPQITFSPIKWEIVSNTVSPPIYGIWMVADVSPMEVGDVQALSGKLIWNQTQIDLCVNPDSPPNESGALISVRYIGNGFLTIGDGFQSNNQAAGCSINIAMENAFNNYGLPINACLAVKSGDVNYEYCAPLTINL